MAAYGLNAGNPYGIEPGSKNYASRTFAALTRDQWNTYLSQFVPLENELIEYSTSDATVANAVGEARQDVATAFDQQPAIQARELRGLGVSLNADEQRASERSTGLARSLAEVNAGNITAQRVRDRQQSILGNPAPAIKGEV